MGRQDVGGRPREGLIPNPKLKFLDQCHEVRRFKQFSRRTEETYVQWIRRFILFWRRKDHTSPRPSALQAGAEREKASGGWIWLWELGSHLNI